MNRLICLMLLSAGLLSGKAALANLALARTSHCMSCHSIDNKVVGPAFKDVAKRYAGKPEAENNLVKKVLQGGAGNWGVVAMPKNTSVSETDARLLVKWILDFK